MTIGPDGKTVLYTPHEDFSGNDSFVYMITDDHGGTDFATANVTIEAVADVPNLVVTKHAGATVNEIIIDVTATQTDADSSEYIDRLELKFFDSSGNELSGPPAGVTIATTGDLTLNPGDQPDQLIRQFVLTLPADGNSDFDVKVAAVSKEVSNGDEQVGLVNIALVYVHKTTTTSVDFTADNQSIWNTGPQFKFDRQQVLRYRTGVS